MNDHIRSIVLLLIAALAPVSVSADLIDISEVKLTAFASFTTQLLPQVTDSDIQIVPFSDPTQAEALVLAGNFNVPFPNIPTSQTKAFASATADGRRNFGVGVNGFFFQNSLPPNALVASGTFSQTVTNNSDFTVPISANFFIPPPTLAFFGIGEFFPPGADPARDATASVGARIVTKLTHPDGSIVEDIPLDYGMRLFRDPVIGLLFAIPTVDAEGEVRQFEFHDGSLNFVLPERLVDGLKLGDIGPGDVFEYTYEFFADASTGFGETGIFAAIGDPFDLTVGGGRFDLQVGDPLPPGPGPRVPEPATWTLLASGLLALRFGTRLSHARMR
jgi:hypothetical protein